MGAGTRFSLGTRHVVSAVLEAVLIVATVLALVFAYAAVTRTGPFGAGSVLAAKGGHHSPAGVAGCNVTPDPVARGGMYTVSGGGAPTDAYLNIWVTDSHGTTVLLSPVAADGTFSASSYASWSGTSTVTVKDISGKVTVLTTCSFDVS